MSFHNKVIKPRFEPRDLESVILIGYFQLHFTMSSDHISIKQVGLFHFDDSLLEILGIGLEVRTIQNMFSKTKHNER